MSIRTDNFSKVNFINLTNRPPPGQFITANQTGGAAAGRRAGLERLFPGAAGDFT